MKLIIGLGNPGKKYEKTKHNLGFIILDNYLLNKNIILDKKKFNGKYTKTKLFEEDVIFAKPLTFMNNSGSFVASLISYFNIRLEDVLIIVDDKDQKLGVMKFKNNSSSGGHNGIKNIIELLGTKEFKRLKIGIGEPKVNEKTTSFVLKEFVKKELEVINLKLPLILELIDDFIKGVEFSKLENKYNGK